MMLVTPPYLKYPVRPSRALVDFLILLYDMLSLRPVQRGVMRDYMPEELSPHYGDVRHHDAPQASPRHISNRDQRFITRGVFTLGYIVT